jgi:hypothetical protein
MRRRPRQRFTLAGVFLVTLMVPGLEAGALRFEGLASARFQGWQLEGSSPWNPANILDRDTRRAGWRLNLDSSLSLQHLRIVASPTASGEDGGKRDVVLREAYVTFDLGAAELTAGKAIVELGTGYAFTPISVFSPEVRPSDPEDQDHRQEGVSLIKLDYFAGDILCLSLTAYESMHRGNVAFLGSTHAHGLDLYTLANLPSHGRLEVGGAVSTTLDDNLELHAELMHRRVSPIVHHQVFLLDNPEVSFTSDPRFDPAPDRYLELVVGANLTLGQLHLIAEYYHNDWGLKPQWYERLRRHYRYNLGVCGDPSVSIDVQSDLGILSQGTRGLMRDYLFVRASRSLGPVQAVVMVYLNLHDRSAVNMLQLEAELGSRVVAYGSGAWMTGGQGSEFGDTWYRGSIDLGLRARF